MGPHRGGGAAVLQLGASSRSGSPPTPPLPPGVERRVGWWTGLVFFLQNETRMSHHGNGGRAEAGHNTQRVRNGGWKGQHWRSTPQLPARLEGGGRAGGGGLLRQPTGWTLGVGGVGTSRAWSWPTSPAAWAMAFTQTRVSDWEVRRRSGCQERWRERWLAAAEDGQTSITRRKTMLWYTQRRPGEVGPGSLHSPSRHR